MIIATAAGQAGEPRKQATDPIGDDTGDGAPDAAEDVLDPRPRLAPVAGDQAHHDLNHALDHLHGTGNNRDDRGEDRLHEVEQGLADQSASGVFHRAYEQIDISLFQMIGNPCLVR